MDRHRDHDELPIDPELDALLRAVATGEDGPARLPGDENDLLAYLAGEADEETAIRIRRALADSPVLRRELLEVAADLDRLEEIVTAPAPWEQARRRARRPDPARGVREFLAGFFRQPAFVAAAAVFLLMAYPTFRYLGGGDGGPPVGPARTLHLDAGGPALRGEGEAAPPTVTLGDGGAAVLTLSLWSDTPYDADEPVALEILNDGRVAWRADAWRVARDPDEPGRLDLSLDTKLLRPGPVTVTVTRGSGTTERYRFELR